MKVDHLCLVNPSRLPKNGVQHQLRDIRSNEGWDIDWDPETGIAVVSEANGKKFRAFMPGSIAWVEFSEEQATEPKKAKK